MDEETDGQLVRRALRGDLAAFEALVERHRTGVVALAWSRLGCLDDGEDIAQDTFVQAFFRLPQLREAEKFRPWLRRIAERLCLMHLRRRREDCVEPAEAESLGVVATPPEESRLQEALANLPEEMRLTIRLTYLHGYTTAEAAEILGVQRGTVKSRLSRARAALRKDLETMGEREPASAFTNEVTERLMQRARELFEQKEYEAAEKPLDEVLGIQFEHGIRFDPDAVRMAETVWEQLRQRDAEANARQYGKRLQELDWRVGRFNVLSNSLAHSGGEGKDIWGVPSEINSFDARDICRRLKVSPTTLHRWVQQGLPAIRYRPWVRFDYNRVKAWLAEQGITPRPDITLAQAGRPLRFLFTEIEADRLTAEQAEHIFRELDLPAV